MVSAMPHPTLRKAREGWGARLSGLGW